MSMSETAKRLIIKHLQENIKVYYIDLDPEYRINQDHDKASYD